MEVYKAVKTRRTIRKFKSQTVEEDILLKLIDGARLAPFGANLQPLKYKIISDENIRKEFYPHIRYAGYTPDFKVSFKNSPPTFIAVFNDEKIKPTSQAQYDAGSAIANMCLVATELGVDTCILGAINRAFIEQTLNLGENLKLLYLVGVGYGAQTGEYFDDGQTVKYFFDENENLKVPKRPLNDILL